mmetsp:Transcript_58164/g.161105  ORF Transcript_58164/g.161105 Transcript_58164/m.161105 type:complete len:434 (-) Transcript_58164:2-1303(-)
MHKSEIKGDRERERRGGERAPHHTYLEDFGVSHEFLHRVLGVEPRSSEDLDCVRSTLVGMIPRKGLSHRCVERVRSAFVDLDRRLVRQQTRRLDAHGHIRQHEADRLVLDDFGAHRLPLLRVLERLVHGTAGHANSTRGDRRAGVVERPHCNLEAGPDLAEHILLRYHHVVKEEWPRIRAPLAHVDELVARRHALGAGVDDEPCHRLARAGSLVGHGEHEIPVCNTAVGDPQLASVDDPLVALLLRSRLDGGDITARSRLAHAVCTFERFLRHPAQILFLLEVVARENHWHLREGVRFHGSLDSRAAIRELFRNDAPIEGVHARAAVVLRNVRIHKTKLPCLLENIVRERHRAVVLGGLRDDHVGSELPRHILDHFLVVVQHEADATTLRREGAGRRSRREETAEAELGRAGSAPAPKRHGQVARGRVYGRLL